MKSIFTSKTFWLNIAMFALPAVSQPAYLALQQHPHVVGGIIAGLNIANRFLTSGQVSITGN